MMKMVSAGNWGLILFSALTALFSLGFVKGCNSSMSPFDPAELYSHVTKLAGEIGTRNIEEPGNILASVYISDKLKEYGLLNVHYDYFPDGYGNLYRNVAGICPGTTYPDLIILICAHFDTKKGVPGAVDNATGIAALLEYARYFSDNPAPYTIKFVAFNAEESGYFGSSYYHRKSLKSGELENTLMILNLDMVQSNASNPEAPLVFFVLSPNRASIRSFSEAKDEMGMAAVNFLLIPAKVASALSFGLRTDGRFWIDDELILCWPWAYDTYYNKPVDTCDKVDKTGLAISTRFIFGFLNRMLKCEPEDFRDKILDYEVSPVLLEWLKDNGGIKP
jgi:hypothetical protein